MAQIPLDIVREILLRLPAEFLLRFRAVCREWCNIIDDKSFIHSHTSSQISPTTLLFRNSSNKLLYSISIDSLINCADDNRGNIEATCVSGSELSGIYFPSLSCNGLILLHPENTEKNWVILNPCTRKFHQLPRLEGLKGCAHVGLGYDSSSDDYKVVAIGTYPFQRCSDPFYGFVYSMKTDSWRKIANVDPRHITLYYRNGVSVDGVLHWKSRTDYSLTRFNLATETFDEVLPRPKTEHKCGDWFWDFGFSDGCLVVSMFYEKGKCSEGWVMKEGGWMKLFSIKNSDGFMMPIAYLKRKGLILLSNCSKRLYLLDVEKNSMRMVCIKGLPIDIYSVSYFSGSLVQLDRSTGAGTGADARLKLPISIRTC